MKKLLYLAFVFPILLSAQTIKGTFSPAKDFKYAFLYKSTPTGAEYINRGQLDSLGKFEIKLDSTVLPGIYKIVYNVPPQNNYFDIFYDGKESIDLTFSREKGLEFNESEENKLWHSYIKSRGMIDETIYSYYDKNEKDEEGYMAIMKTLKDTQAAYEESTKDRLIKDFIAANKPYIPSVYEDLDTYNLNVKNNFLKNVDFGNPLLQSSNVLDDKVIAYAFNAGIQGTNSDYKKNIDVIHNTIKHNDLNIKQRLFQILWFRFSSINNQVLADYISDNYLMAIAKEANNQQLIDTLIAHKNTAIGALAPNFDLIENDTNSSLHDLNGADNYLLVFWSSTCPHCLNELPTVKKLTEENPNLKVIAFGLENDEMGWSKTIKDYPSFLHVLGLKKWKNPIVKTYGVAGTPQYFILNKDKTIKSKPYSIEDLEKAINAL